MVKFKEIPNSRGYLIGSDGTVISRFGKVLSARKQAHGYMAVVILGKNRSIHRLVAFAFVPNPLNLNEVHHIDNNKKNNKVENLKWVTRAENMRLSVQKNGQDSPVAKLKNKDVKKIREMYALGGTTYKKIAKLFNIHEEHVGCICRRQVWRHVI